jgi:CubicO group peptidase (beta-lactamase class C family)
MRDDVFVEVDSRIRRELVESSAPSLAVAVARDGEILWEQAYGWANRERRMPATPHIMYSLASTTKPFTASALMKLVERDQTALDAPVNDYLAEDARIKVRIGDPADVTVRRVANHTAGLPRHEHFFSSAEPYRRPPMEETIRRYANVVALPGERYRYSNIGYGVIEHLIERLSGMSLGDFLRREFFLPLGMTRSAVDVGPGLADFAADRYDQDGRPIPFYDVDHRGASSVYCSAHDLLLFGMFHLGQLRPDQRAPLARKTVTAMWEPTADRHNFLPEEVRHPPASGYGIGWVIDDTAHGPLLNHAGGMAGASAQLVLLPGEGIAIAAMANGPCSIPREIERYILPALLPQYVDTMTMRLTTSPTRGYSASVLQACPGLQGEWRGQVYTYQKAMPLTLTFTASGDIHARLGELQQTTLVNDACLREGWLTGTMAGRIETEDACRHPYRPDDHLELDLRLRDEGRITGAVIHVARDALSHWVDLRKQ